MESFRRDVVKMSQNKVCPTKMLTPKMLQCKTSRDQNVDSMERWSYNAKYILFAAGLCPFKEVPILLLFDFFFAIYAVTNGI